MVKPNWARDLKERGQEMWGKVLLKDPGQANAKQNAKQMLSKWAFLGSSLPDLTNLLHSLPIFPGVHRIFTKFSTFLRTLDFVSK